MDRGLVDLDDLSHVECFVRLGRRRLRFIEGISAVAVRPLDVVRRERAENATSGAEDHSDGEGDGQVKEEVLHVRFFVRRGGVYLTVELNCSVHHSVTWDVTLASAQAGLLRKFIQIIYISARMLLLLDGLANQTWRARALHGIIVVVVKHLAGNGLLIPYLCTYVPHLSYLPKRKKETRRIETSTLLHQCICFYQNFIAIVT